MRFVGVLSSLYLASLLVLLPCSTQAQYTSECLLSSSIDLVGDGSLLLRQAINPSTSTVSVELEYDGTGWVGFAFSESQSMVPNTAIIGLPDEGAVRKYDMTIRDPSGVLEASSDRQTLTATSINQDSGSTILKFTRALEESGETTVVAGTNTILVAYGSSDTLGFHKSRIATTATFTECSTGTGSSPVVAPVAAPVAAPTAGNALDLGSGRTQSSTFFEKDGVTVTFIADTAKQTLTVTMEYAGLAWISFAFAETEYMPNSLAVIALPDDGTGTPSKYDIGNGRSEDVIVVAPTERQTLTEASYAQNSTHTTMTFTKALMESNELPILLTGGSNNFLYAVGSSNTFGYHARRAAFARNFASLEDSGGGGSTGSRDTKSLWIAHGILMVIGWTILVPLAVGTAVLRSFLALPTGQWFQIHRLLNGIAVACTIASFAIAVHNIKQEQGSSANHFTNTYQHHKMGLVIFIFAILQALSGMFRPHLPHKPEPEIADEEAEGEKGADDVALKKSPQRIAFEIQHRLIGTTAMILGWFNVDSGIDLYNERFGGKDLTPAAWAVSCGIVGVVLICFLYDRFLKKKD